MFSNIFLFISLHPFCSADFQLSSGQGSFSLNNSNLFILGASRKYLKKFWHPTHRAGPEIKWVLYSSLETSLFKGAGRQIESAL